jgi:hypothetical protein
MPIHHQRIGQRTIQRRQPGAAFRGVAFTERDQHLDPVRLNRTVNVGFVKGALRRLRGRVELPTNSYSLRSCVSPRIILPKS